MRFNSSLRTASAALVLAVAAGNVAPALARPLILPASPPSASAQVMPRELPGGQADAAALQPFHVSHGSLPPAATTHVYRGSLPPGAYASATHTRKVSAQAATSGSFDWGDAGIGAAGGLVLSVLGVGGALTLSQRRRRPPAGQPALVG
jgi:hypothetical protein